MSRRSRGGPKKPTKKALNIEGRGAGRRRILSFRKESHFHFTLVISFQKRCPAGSKGSRRGGDKMRGREVSAESDTSLPLSQSRSSLGKPIQHGIRADAAPGPVDYRRARARQRELLTSKKILLAVHGRFAAPAAGSQDLVSVDNTWGSCLTSALHLCSLLALATYCGSSKKRHKLASRSPTRDVRILLIGKAGKLKSNLLVKVSS